MPMSVESAQVFSRGQSGLVDPSLLRAGLASRLYNVDIRNGLARTRNALGQETLPVQGRFQGAFEYRLNQKDYLVVVVAGQVWLRLSQTGAWTKVGEFPTTDFHQAYFTQADRFGIVQNGITAPVENWPVIFHGETPVDNLESRYLDGSGFKQVKNWPVANGGPDTVRVPIGTAMAYGHGRLFVAVDRYYDDGAASGMNQEWKRKLGRIHWSAGNVIQSGLPEEVLVFTEQYIIANGGPALSLPAEMGFITSMGFLRNSESGTGLGAMIVFAQRGACAFAVNLPRASWIRSPDARLGQVLFTSSGSASPWGLAAVNSDLVYYGERGLRTLKYSASNETSTGGLASVSLSPEVSNFTRLTDPALHEPYVTMAYVDNYLFFTGVGVGLPTGDVAFKAVMPWDLASFQVSGEPPSRVFSGAWCGQLVHAVVADRAAAAPAAVYRTSADSPLYFGSYTESSAGVPAAVWTASLMFDAAVNRKKVKHIDVSLDQVDGPLGVRAMWQWDGAGEWYTTQVRKFTGTGSTGMVRIPGLGDAGGSGFQCQFRLEWTGAARLRLAVFTANVLDVFSGDGSLCKEVVLDNIADDNSFVCPGSLLTET